MFVRYLCVDDKRAPPPLEHPDFGVTRNPTLDDISAAINSLDGDFIRLVILSVAEPSGDSHFPWTGRGMLIGGGGDNGLYTCMIGMEDETTAHYLCNPDAPRTEKVEIMRGHMTDMDRKHCVDKTTLVNSVLAFAQTGAVCDVYTLSLIHI